MNSVSESPAGKAAAEAMILVRQSIDERKSFILEAGPGSGKTHSLVESLRYIVNKHGVRFAREGRKIACITFTNVAKSEIETRVGKASSVVIETIHAFLWSVIRRFQVQLREILPSVGKWSERTAEKGAIQMQEVIYDLGYPSLDSKEIHLYHDDIIELATKLLENRKFRTILAAQYPIILIDEYQDTDLVLGRALQTHFLQDDSPLLLGLFGDHWQMIYDERCGKISSPVMREIPKRSNFRSSSSIVKVLNKMRPDLPQEIVQNQDCGSALCFHTNRWTGMRLTGPHDKGDLPNDVAHQFLESVQARLVENGWRFDGATTKILMLTHNVLASEQGYRELAAVFKGNTAQFANKEDPYIAFFTDIVEPMCLAYESHRYGAMFAILGKASPSIIGHRDKQAWAKDMKRLQEVRQTGTVKDVLSVLRQTRKPRLSVALETREEQVAQPPVPGVEEPSGLKRAREIQNIPYRQVIALARFINGSTCFATKHSVKGEEYENVLVVAGRGWNKYNFDQMLSWMHTAVPAGKEESFRRSRNLLYVAFSRPKRNLAVLFTQQISSSAMAELESWFGTDSVIAL